MYNFVSMHLRSEKYEKECWSDGDLKEEREIVRERER